MDERLNFNPEAMLKRKQRQLKEARKAMEGAKEIYKQKKDAFNKVVDDIIFYSEQINKD